MKPNIFRGILSNNRKKFIVIRQNSLGNINLSFHAIKLLAGNKVEALALVEKAKTEVQVSDSGLNLNIKLSVKPGTGYEDLPRMVNDLVREELYAKAGIEVYRIKVNMRDMKED